VIYVKRIAAVITAFTISLVYLTAAAHADHSLFPIYNITHLTTTEGDIYNFHSPGINYTFNGRNRIGFFTSLSIFFPLRSNQNGESYKNSDFYRSKLGGDFMLGADMKFQASDKISIVPALGGHVNGIRLRAKEIYKDFYHLTFGLGLNVQTRYEVSDRMDGTLLVSGGWHFIDLIHRENRLDNGLIFTGGIGLTF
jgi:hypothetical protein